MGKLFLRGLLPKSGEPVRPDGLQRILEKVDAAAVLVAPQVLNGLIQKVGKLPVWTWRKPHPQCFVVDRQMLFLYFDQEELGLEPGRLLPPTLILLPRPAAENLADRGKLLLKYWRRLFHARVHLALTAEDKLPPERVLERVSQIGPSEFEEIRHVLGQEHLLLPEAGDRDIYIEFAAVYWELRFFAPNLLDGCFPGLRDRDRIDQLLAQDLDARELFEQTRLPGARDPAAPPDNLVDEAHLYYRKLMSKANLESQAGNTVRSAILRRQAARVAPDPQRMEAEAKAALHDLTRRLQTALDLTAAEVEEWHQDLATLLDKADQGSHPVEAALLFDLQKLCLEHESDLFALDLVGWLLSGFKQPIKRSLPRQKPVLIIRHLRNAGQRLTRARLSDADRQHIGQFLQQALHRCEDRLRLEFRGILTSAFQDAGLEPVNLPERAAYHKVIEEVLDRIVAEGFLTFADLRDTISRNQLKLRDLADPQAFIFRDTLLRLDKRLAALLDGVYRPSDIYVRWLERLSALNFGTATGRFITRYVTLPFGAAFVLVEGFQLLFKVSIPDLAYYPILLLFGAFFLALLHRQTFRRRCRDLAIRAWHRARVLVVDVPAWIVQVSSLGRLLRTWSFQLLYWYVFKPLVVCALVWLLFPDVIDSVIVGVSVFLAANFLLNARPGQAAGEALKQGLWKFLDLLRGGLIPGLVRLIINLFKYIMHLMELVLATVDEWLLFRTGQGRFLMIARTVLGVIWFPISYLGRFYMVVLIEPGINPIKFPVSSIAAKFIYPFGVLLTGWLAGVLSPVVGDLLAGAVAVSTVWLLPDAFGFLFWELKENWSLFAANRSRTLMPVMIGAHGETMVRFLRPGFHSGTVPKLFARLRQAERRAQHTGNWSAVRACRQHLDEVAETVKRFVDRDFLYLLQLAPDWKGQLISVGQITLATNQIGIELCRDGLAGPALWLDFQERSGRLLASIRQPGWQDHLAESQKQTFQLGLAGLYKWAGVDVVDQIDFAKVPLGWEAFVHGWQKQPAGNGKFFRDLLNPLPVAMNRL